MTESKFEKQLQALLSGEEINNQLDALDENGQPLEVPEMLPVVYEEKNSLVDIDGSDVLDDYKFARSNLYGLIGRTNSGIELMLKIAAMSEHPRALEVLANLLKTSSEITKDLLQLQKQLQGESKSKKPTGNYTQNNHFYNSNTKPSEVIDNELDNLPDA